MKTKKALNQSDLLKMKKNDLKTKNLAPYVWTR